MSSKEFTSSTGQVFVTNRDQGVALPASDFQDVLEGLPPNNEGANNSWARPPFPSTNGVKPNINAQAIDITESRLSSGTSELWIFGVTKAGHSILARVQGFDHYFYYPAPLGILRSDMDPLRKYVNNILYPSTRANRSPLSGISSIELVSEKTAPAPVGRDTQLFNSGRCKYRNLFAALPGSCEARVPYHLRFMLDTGINAMTWLKFVADKYDIIQEADKISTCQLEILLQYNDKHIQLCSPRDKKTMFAPLRILSYDIETNIPSTGSFPSAAKDSVIQIGNMFCTHGETEPTIRIIFTLGSCAPIEGAQVRSFKTEVEMLLAWRKFVLEIDPDIVTGYNITKFDAPYLLNRATTLSIPQFAELGRIKSWRQALPFPFMKVDYFSQCPGYNGRLLLDVFEHIREGNYVNFQGPGKSKLNYVAQVALGDQKEDLPYREIPLLQAGDANTRQRLAIYCLKDTYLPLRIFTTYNLLDRETTAAQEAHVSLNSKREKPFLKHLSKECRKALKENYIISDSEITAILRQR